MGKKRRKQRNAQTKKSQQNHAFSPEKNIKNESINEEAFYENDDNKEYSPNLLDASSPSSLPVVVASLMEDVQTEQLLCWSGLTYTTSGLNEVNLLNQNYLSL